MALLVHKVRSALDMLGTLLVIAAASALLWTVIVKQPARGATPPPTVEDVKATVAKTHLMNSVGHGPLAIVEFADFQCPYCAKHSQEHIPELKKQLEGRARYFVMNLPLESIHPQAVSAAEAAECAAAQDGYWEMHDLLFTKQKELAGADYVAYAHALELDTDRFKECLESEAALAKVKSDQALAKSLGASGTPTLFLGRMRSDGGVDLVKRFNGVVDVALIVAEAQKL